MVSIDKTDVKTAQGNMRHANPEIMLSKYAQAVTDEMHDVQVRWFASCGLGVGQNLLVKTPGVMQSDDPKRAYVVSADGLEPSTHALKGHCSAN